MADDGQLPALDLLAVMLRAGLDEDAIRERVRAAWRRAVGVERADELVAQVDWPARIAKAREEYPG
jgi:hypothetical protein